VASQAGDDAEPIVTALDPEALRLAINRGVAEIVEQAEPEAPDVLDLEPRELRGVIEALLLVSTKPLKTEQLCKCLPGAEASYLDGFCEGLSLRYEREGRGFDLRRLAKGWQLLTRPAFHPWVRRLSRKELPSRLTRSAMETLAIVAYKQPITRGAIEDIRGVQCGPMLRQLMDLKLVQVLGRDEALLGRPLLYGTSDDFLHRFGLGDIGDLPRSHEFGI
jgi:segregation and condensation protein B